MFMVHTWTNDCAWCIPMGTIGWVIHTAKVELWVERDYVYSYPHLEPVGCNAGSRDLDDSCAVSNQPPPPSVFTQDMTMNSILWVAFEGVWLLVNNGYLMLANICPWDQDALADFYCNEYWRVTDMLFTWWHMRGNHALHHTSLLEVSWTPVEC